MAQRSGVLFFFASMLVCSIAKAADAPHRHVSEREWLSEKTGQVLDVDTGQPIEGVGIVVTWDTLSELLFSGGNASGDSEWCDDQKVVLSDSDGKFTIPDVTSEIGGTEFGLHELHTRSPMYHLRAFKSGYVRIIKWRGQTAESATGDWVYEQSPEIHLSKRGFELAPILMKKKVMSPQERLTTVDLIMRDTACGRVTSSNGHSLLQLLSDEVRPLPCAMPAAGRPNENEFRTYVWATRSIPQIEQYLKGRFGQLWASSAGRQISWGDLCDASNTPPQ
jgi:hypothetical protein